MVAAEICCPGCVHFIALPDLTQVVTVSQGSCTGDCVHFGWAIRVTILMNDHYADPMVHHYCPAAHLAQPLPVIPDHISHALWHAS